MRASWFWQLLCSLRLRLEAVCWFALFEPANAGDAKKCPAIQDCLSRKYIEKNFPGTKVHIVHILKVHMFPDPNFHIWNYMSMYVVQLFLLLCKPWTFTSSHAVGHLVIVQNANHPHINATRTIRISWRLVQATAPAGPQCNFNWLDCHFVRCHAFEFTRTESHRHVRIDECLKLTGKQTWKDKALK